MLGGRPVTGVAAAPMQKAGRSRVRPFSLAWRPCHQALPPPAGWVPEAYCISDRTSCDMLLLCFSIEVLACSSICLEVMLAVSVA